jgi:hypothetical protein
MVAWLAMAVLSLLVTAGFLLVRLQANAAGSLTRASAVGAGPSAAPAVTPAPSARVVPPPPSSSAHDAGEAGKRAGDGN